MCSVLCCLKVVFPAFSLLLPFVHSAYTLLPICVYKRIYQWYHKLKIGLKKHLRFAYLARRNGEDLGVLSSDLAASPCIWAQKVSKIFPIGWGRVAQSCSFGVIQSSLQEKYKKGGNFVVRSNCVFCCLAHQGEKLLISACRSREIKDPAPVCFYALTGSSRIPGRTANILFVIHLSWGEKEERS